MKIRVTGWQYRNLRGIGVGEQSIELGVPPKRWSLIQMPNGTGKTTTMKLIRAILSGQAFTPQEVREFRADDEVTSGGFDLGLLIDDKQYRLTLTFDFNSGDCSRSTLRTKERGGGQEDGRVLPLALKRRLKQNFTRLFVFDGELANEIRAVDRAEADHAIKALYQLDDLDTLKKRVEKVVTECQDKAAPLSHAKSQRGLTRTRNAFTKANTELADLEKKRSDFKAEQSSLEEERNTAQTKISTCIAEDDDLKAKKEEIEKRAASIRSNLQRAAVDAMDAFRSPVSLSSTIRTRLSDLGACAVGTRMG